MKPRTFSPRRSAVQRRHRTRGMSLIEILCAVMIMTVGIMGLVALMARASQASLSTDDAQRAALLADDLANTMWLTNQISQPAATINAWNTRVGNTQAGGLPNGRGTVAVANQVATITITWQAPGEVPSDDATRQRRYSTQVRLN